MSKLQKELQQWLKEKEKMSLQAVTEKKPKPKKETSKTQLAIVEPKSQQAVRRGPPLAQLIHRALETLQREARPLTEQELREADKETGRWVDRQVMDALRANEKVAALEGGRVAYKAKFVANGRDELLSLLQRRPEGTRMSELIDCYRGDVEGVRVKADVAELVETGALYGLQNGETKELVVYPRDPSYELEMDDRIQTMWLRMEVPTEPAAFLRELNKAGIQQAARGRAPRPLTVHKEDRKKKKRRDFSKLHVTNVHLWDELFADKSLETADALD